jgi:hypothetical protein
LEPLTSQRKRPVPTTLAVVAQTRVTLVISFASQLFLAQLDGAEPALGLSAVVVVPLTPERQPESVNAIIRLRQARPRCRWATSAVP